MSSFPDPFASRSTTPQSIDSERANSYSPGSRESSGHHGHHPEANFPPLSTSPLTPHTASEPLLQSASRYAPSPLNPNTPNLSESRASMVHLVSSEESYSNLGVSYGGYPSLSRRESPHGQGSMLLYKLASEPGGPWGDDDQPLPPTRSRYSPARFSTASDSGFSTKSGPSDSKYPTEKTVKGVFMPYAYDPILDQMSPPDADDVLHDPNIDKFGQHAGFNLRGFANIAVLTLLVAALICLFTLYPIISFLQTNTRNLAIDNNVQVNGTGQVPVLPSLPQLIDVHTPDSAKTHKGWDGHQYELVFSDEFNVDGRTFYPGDDPFWEAVDLWYGATKDLEWYDAGQATTVNGSLRLRIEQADPASNHGLNYKSGMIQSWNKFCFTGGYIEISASFPGANSDVSGYWPGAWIMGNLGRPGYGATTDGMWPYTYNACDTGTFPNQTNKDGTPPAAVHTDHGRPQYNFELSWLPGQRVSACTCPGSEHPGPNVNVGRGAPEIDILEAQKNKLGEGGKVSQSAQFAPFNHDYISLNGTGQATFYNPAITAQNGYQGSALQQAVSALTTVPDRAYAGTGGQFVSFGFEYFSDPGDPSTGFITWQVDGTPSYAVTAAAVGADPLTDISQRLISVEPMSIILNLGMSTSFQPVNFDQLTFPADFLIDYIRVYQRTDNKNIGCDPPDYPTSQYIANHIEAYTNPNLTFWGGDPSTGFHAGYSWPKNSQYDGC